MRTILAVLAALALAATAGARGPIPGSTFEVRCGATTSTSIVFEWDSVPDAEDETRPHPMGEHISRWGYVLFSSDWMFREVGPQRQAWADAGWAERHNGTDIDPDCPGCDARDQLGYSRWTNVAQHSSDRTFRATRLEPASDYSLAVYAAVLETEDHPDGTATAWSVWIGRGAVVCTTLPDPLFTPDPNHPRHYWDPLQGR